MPKLFECCHKCKPPKRGPTCHSTCPEYLRDAAENERLKAIDRQKGYEADRYAINTVLGVKDEYAKRHKRSHRNCKTSD